MKTPHVLVLALLCSACATTARVTPEAPPPEGEVAMEEKPAMERPQSTGDVDYSKMLPTFPEAPVSQDLPLYPEEALADAVACEAELLVHVLTDGTVKIVELAWVRAPALHGEAFETSMKEAIGSWLFEPAWRWVPKKREDGSEAGGRVEIPKARRVVFRFSVVDGRGVVE